jgi:hypothetical protein
MIEFSKKHRCLVQIILLTLIISIGGYNKLAAHTCKERTIYPLLKNIKCGQYSSADTWQMFVEPGSLSPEKQNDASNESFFEKEEDDEFISSKKHLEAGNIGTCVSLAQIPVCFYSCNEHILPCSACISYISSYRYLIFQAFRI